LAKRKTTPPTVWALLRDVEGTCQAIASGDLDSRLTELHDASVQWDVSEVRVAIRARRIQLEVPTDG